MVVISLRSCGYRMPHDSIRRHVALDRGVRLYGFDAIMDRLEYVKNSNSIYADQTEDDIWYIVIKRNEYIESVKQKRLRTLSLIDNTVRTIQAGIGMDDIQMIIENYEILKELMKMLRDIV